MEDSSESGRRPRPVAPLAHLLEGVLANMDLRSRFREHLAILAWPQVAGRAVSAHTRAEAVRDGVLIVAADTSAWAHELQMRREQVLARIAEQVGSGVIRDVHFRTGGASRGERRKRRAPRPAEIELPPRQQRQIQAAAASIQDPQLRARAERAFAAVARISEWRRQTGWRRCARCGRWQQSGRRWCATCLHAGQRRRGR